MRRSEGIFLAGQFRYFLPHASAEPRGDASYLPPHMRRAAGVILRAKRLRRALYAAVGIAAASALMLGLLLLVSFGVSTAPQASRATPPATRSPVTSPVKQKVSSLLKR